MGTCFLNSIERNTLKQKNEQIRRDFLSCKNLHLIQRRERIGSVVKCLSVTVADLSLNSVTALCL